MWSHGGIAAIGGHTWIIASYELARKVLEDSKVKVAAPFGSETQGDFVRLPRSDSEEYATLRAALRIGIRERLANVELAIQEAIRSILHKAVSMKSVDAVADIAGPIAEAGLFLTIGVPPNHWNDLSLLGRQVGVGPSLKMTDTASRQLYSADLALRSYFANNYDEALTREHFGLANEISVATTDAIAGSQLAATLALLTEAGLVTSTDFLTSVIVASPWLAQGGDAPAQIRQGLQEIARASSPVHTATSRYAADDICLGDKTVKRGDHLVVLLDAANHDPAAFGNPFVLDVEGNSGRHIAFGSGSHRCPGVKLARILAENVARLLIGELGVIARPIGPASNAVTASGVGFIGAPVQI